MVIVCYRCVAYVQLFKSVLQGGSKHETVLKHMLASKKRKKKKKKKTSLSPSPADAARASPGSPQGSPAAAEEKGADSAGAGGHGSPGPAVQQGGLVSQFIDHYTR